jgi:hypothetical protein
VTVIEAVCEFQTITERLELKTRVIEFTIHKTATFNQGKAPGKIRCWPDRLRVMCRLELRPLVMGASAFLFRIVAGAVVRDVRLEECRALRRLKDTDWRIMQRALPRLNRWKRCKAARRPQDLIRVGICRANGHRDLQLWHHRR